MKCPHCHTALDPHADFHTCGANHPAPWGPLAAYALRAAIGKDMYSAIDYLNQISQQHGDDVIGNVMLAWLDTTIAYCGVPTTPNGTVAIAWQYEHGGPIRTADEVPAPLAWAGRLMAARAADDEDQFVALLNSVPDNNSWRLGILSVLDICSSSLRVCGFTSDDPTER